MNHAITIGFKTSGTPFVITGPEVPIEQQTSAFKALVAKGVEDCESIELWTSSMGRTKHKKLRAAQAASAEPDTATPTTKTRKPKTS
jgi:hypothetical protein